MAEEGIEEFYLNSTDYFGNFSMEEHLPYHKRPEAYVVPIVFSVIFVVGIVGPLFVLIFSPLLTGNVTLVIMFTRNKSLRSVPNTYIISLALGDLLVLLFTVPFVSFIYVLESWPFGVVICKCSEFVREVSVGVTVFTLTALSADRYMAIVSPLPKVGMVGMSSTL
ncbi:G protein-coupled receptor rhodopsin-like [Trinorchestia longiramus]|nr:G protein-coupled receptor rhodopsin-like [Trinorchestia longiramus]